MRTPAHRADEGVHELARGQDLTDHWQGSVGTRLRFVKLRQHRGTGGGQRIDKWHERIWWQIDGEAEAVILKEVAVKDATTRSQRNMRALRQSLPTDHTGDGLRSAVPR